MSDFQNLLANLAITQYDFDPDATTATEIAWVDMNEFKSLAVSFFRKVGTSAITFKIMGNSASDGSGTDVDIKTKTMTDIQPDAVGDYSWLTVNEDEIATAAGAAGEDVRYLTAVVSVATGTDEGVVTYVREAKHRKLNLTADKIA